MALSSLLLNHRQADITATDYHPTVEYFLDRNTTLNNNRGINFERLDWSEDNSHLGRFDIIIGSDLLYVDQHIGILAEFIERHALPTCEVIVVNPGRGRKNKLTNKMIEFCFSSKHVKPDNTTYLALPFKEHILTFSRSAV